MTRSRVHPLHQKKQGFFCFLLLSYVVTSDLPLLLSEYFSTCIQLVSFQKYTPGAFVSTEICCRYLERRENYLLVVLVLCRNVQTQQIITCLPSVLRELGIIGLLLLDTIMVIIFISKSLEGIQFRATEGKSYSERCIPPAGRRSQQLRNLRAYKI